MPLQLYIWMLSGVIGAVSGALSSWSFGAWWWCGGLVFGFASGLAGAFICSFPYVALLVYVQKTVPRLQDLVPKVLYIPQMVLGMLLAWLLPPWCLTRIAEALTQ